jgi:hypothetical protein
MSIMKLLGVRSWVLSFVEIVFFFGVLSVAYFAVVLGLYHALAGEPAPVQLIQPTTSTAPASQASSSAPATTPDTQMAASAPATAPETQAATSVPATAPETQATTSAPATAPATQAAEGSRSWLVSTPVWMWIVAGAGYVLLVTLYWAPGDQQLDDAELRAFGVFVVTVVVVGLLYLEFRYDHAVTKQLRLFWTIVSGHYVARGGETSGG